MKKNIFLVIALVMVTEMIYGQCFPNRHSTNFFDGWASCEPAANPNPIRPVSHFILYDFNKVYKLGQMQIWNANDPSNLDWGMRDVAIDYSIDGETWLHAGDFTFPQASGLSTYEGDDGPYLYEVEARYLLITGLSNYGGKCFGLSEMRVSGERVILSDAEEITSLNCVEISMYPNPFAEKITLEMEAGCSGEVRYVLYDALGHELTSETNSLNGGQNKKVEIGRDLPAGSYLLYIESGGKSVQKSLIKMNRT